MNDESIFADAAAIADPDRRRAFLDRECQGNDAHRREIEKLLAAHLASNPLDQPPQDLANTGLYRNSAGEKRSLISEGPGTIIGPYKLMEQIGEGGMGLVFVAEQQKPVRRKVALKVIKPGMDTHQVVARFEAERQALALMDHPHIAKVLDAGTTEAGRPYFVMELVRGVPITEYADAINLPPKERLQLFIQVCQAVQHAHQKGVIHRDLKPSNILVAPHDGIPIVKVIDFGVAKALGQQLTDKTIYTQFSQMIGTPLYMSPEQAEVNQLDVDTRSDIYSLGVLLYELLTGTTPIDRQRFQQAAFDEMRRIIREEEPPRPSTRITSLGSTLPSVSAQRGTDAKRLAALLRGELDWVVMRCLEKDRTRRYDTAVGLAKDVQRYLDDETVDARPPSSIYRFRKMARRNKVAITTASLVAAALFLGLGVSTWQAIRATEAERLAISDRNDKEQARQAEFEHRRIAEEEREKAQSEREKARQERDVAQAAREDLRRAHYAASMNLIPAAWQVDNVNRVIELLEEQKPKPGEKDLRGFEWHYWDRQCHAERWTREITDVVQLSMSTRFNNDCQFSGNGQRLLCVQEYSTDNGNNSIPFRMLDVSTGKEISTFEIPVGTLKTVHTMSISYDGTRIAYFGMNLVVLDTVSGNEVFTLSRNEVFSELGEYGFLTQCFLSPDGKFLAVYFRRPPSGQPTQQPSNQLGSRVDDSLHEIAIWNLSDTKKEPVRIKEGTTPIRDLEFSPDGTRLAGALTPRIGGSSLLSIWDTSTGQILASLSTNDGVIGKIKFSPNGTRIAGISGATRNTGMLHLYLWEATAGKDLKLLRDKPLESFSPVGDHQIIFNPDGRRLLLWGLMSAVKLIDSDTLAELHQYKGVTSIRTASFQPDGTRLLTVGTKSASKTGDASNKPFGRGGSAFLQEWDVPVVVAKRLAASDFVPDTRGKAISTNRDGTRRAIYSSTIPPVGTRSGRQAVAPAEPSSEEDRTISIRDREGKEILVFKQHTQKVTKVQFSPDGRFVVSFAGSRSDGEAFVWETDTGAVRWAWSPIQDTAKADRTGDFVVTFSNDSRLASVPGVDEVRIVSTTDWKTRFAVGQANVVTFSADSRRLISYKKMLQANENREHPSEVKLWNVETGQLIVTLPVDSIPPSKNFSSNSRWFATATADGTEVIVWDLLSGAEQSTIRDAIPNGELNFSPDGSRMIQVGDSFSNIWDPVTGKLISRLEGISKDKESLGPTGFDRTPFLAFSPDGTRIAYTEATGVQRGINRAAVVKIQDISSGRELLELSPKRQGPFFQLLFSLDGHRLITKVAGVGTSFEQIWDATPREQSVQP